MERSFTNNHNDQRPRNHPHYIQKQQQPTQSPPAQQSRIDQSNSAQLNNWTHEDVLIEYQNAVLNLGTRWKDIVANVKKNIQNPRLAMSVIIVLAKKLEVPFSGQEWDALMKEYTAVITTNKNNNNSSSSNSS